MILVLTIAIDFNMLKFQTNWSSSFFEIVYAKRRRLKKRV